MVGACEPLRQQRDMLGGMSNPSNVARIVPRPPTMLQPMGQTGLQNVGSVIREQLVPELNGQAAMRTYKRMGDYDPVCGAILYAIDKLMRRVGWRVEPASSAPNDREAADYIETCMHDMTQTWTDTVSEFCTMIQYGFSLHEVVFKRRLGLDQTDPAFRSRYTDGRLAWRGLPIRSQDTIWRWNFDDHGDILGAEQLAPPTYRSTTLPMDRCLLFRTSSHKGNPEGRSIFLPAYEPWYAKRNIQAIEAVGIERDLAGLPVAWAPADFLADNASPEKKATIERLDEVCSNIRQDEAASIILPLAYDREGREQFKFQLMSSGGSRQFDTDKIVQRYDHRIAMCALADFVLMGQSSSTTGSNAMHTDKTDLFGAAVSAFLDVIATTMQPAIDELIRLNAFKVSESPRIVHDDIEQVELGTMGSFIQQLSAAGMPLFPNPELEARLLEMAKLPKPLDYESAGTSLDDDNHEDTDPTDERAAAISAAIQPIIPPKTDAAGVEAPGDAPSIIGGAAPAGSDQKVSDKALNGAQIQQVTAIVAQVVQGAIPRDSAIAIITLSFLVDEQQANRILGSAGLTPPPAPPVAAQPQPPANPPPAAHRFPPKQDDA